MTPLEILYIALNSKIGIAVTCVNLQSAKSRLYIARKEAGDPALACLQVRTSPYNPDSEIWIVKGTQNAAPGK